MKLLYLSTPSFADCDFPLVKEFQRKGIDVTYLILLPPSSLRSTLFDIKNQIPKTGIFRAMEYPEFRVYESYMDMQKVFVSNRTGKNSLSLSYWKQKYDLYKFIKKGHFDIIHCDYMLSPDMKYLFKLTEVWIQTIHDPFPHSGEISAKKTKSYKSTISQSDYFVLLNNKQKKDFSKLYNVPSEKILVNKLGVYDNIKVFVDQKVMTHKNNVLFFGRISPYKGLEYLCEAMKYVREQIPDATLIIAGGGKMYFDIDTYVRLGYIKLLNHYIGMKELATLLMQCELCVCPYIDATQSGVIMTSYALGKPVIATNIGGLPEMIVEGKTGLLVNPKDSNGLANAIIKLLKNHTRLHEMSHYILSEYTQGENSWKGIAEKYIEFYKSALNSKNQLMNHTS